MPSVVLSLSLAFRRCVALVWVILCPLIRLVSSRGRYVVALGYFVPSASCLFRSSRLPRLGYVVPAFLSLSLFLCRVICSRVRWSSRRVRRRLFERVALVCVIAKIPVPAVGLFVRCFRVHAVFDGPCRPVARVCRVGVRVCVGGCVCARMTWLIVRCLLVLLSLEGPWALWGPRERNIIDGR